VSGVILLRNYQRRWPINARLLRNALKAFLETRWSGISEMAITAGSAQRPTSFNFAFHLVGENKMAELNEGWLDHAGSTDVITFAYGISTNGMLHGEIFICVDEAVAQAPNFGVKWQQEVIRYLLHGVLHSIGYDDRTTRARKRMKAEENKLVRQFLTQPGWSRGFRRPL